MNKILCWLLCWLFGHDYKLRQRITNNIDELICLRCFGEFGINYELEVVFPMDEELRSAHRILVENNGE